MALALAGMDKMPPQKSIFEHREIGACTASARQWIPPTAAALVFILIRTVILILILSFL